MTLAILIFPKYFKFDFFTLNFQGWNRLTTILTLCVTPSDTASQSRKSVRGLTQAASGSVRGGIIFSDIALDINPTVC